MIFDMTESNIYEKKVSSLDAGLGYRIHGKSKGSEGKHIPNKKEGRLLRSIKSQTGLSEDVIRSIPKYAQQLKALQKTKDESKHFLGYGRANSILKNVLSSLKLPREHPLVRKEYNKRRNQILNKGFFVKLPTFDSLF